MLPLQEGIQLRLDVRTQLGEWILAHRARPYAASGVADQLGDGAGGHAHERYAAAGVCTVSHQVQPANRGGHSGAVRPTGAGPYPARICRVTAERAPRRAEQAVLVRGRTHVHLGSWVPEVETTFGEAGQDACWQLSGVLGGIPV